MAALPRNCLKSRRLGPPMPGSKNGIPVGPVGSWDRFNLSIANNDPIVVGDDLRFYYSGRLYRHAPYEGPDKGVQKSSIGFATIKRDRFVSLEGSFDGAEIVTKPLRL